MGWKIRGNLTGVQSMVDNLYWLNLTMRSRTLKRAVTVGSGIVKTAAKQNLKAQNSIETKQLTRSLGIKVKVYKSANVVAVIGPRKGFKIVAIRPSSWSKKPQPIDPVKYAHLVEGGTRPHALGKGSKLPRYDKNGKLIRAGTYQTGIRHPGARRKPFLEPAFYSNRGAIIAAMTAAIQEGISRALVGKRTPHATKRNP